MNQEKASELVIDESNFYEYFFDARLHKPQKGQVLASYTAVGEFCDGPEKRQIIEFMRYTDKVESAVQIMRKVLMAKDPDAYRVPREIAEDLANGLRVEEVAQKSYKFTMEACFWTRPEYIPVDDPHWACVSILNMDQYFAKLAAKDAQESGVSIKAKMVESDHEPCGGICCDECCTTDCAGESVVSGEHTPCHLAD